MKQELAAVGARDDVDFCRVTSPSSVDGPQVGHTILIVGCDWERPVFSCRVQGCARMKQELAAVSAGDDVDFR